MIYFVVLIIVATCLYRAVLAPLHTADCIQHVTHVADSPGVDGAMKISNVFRDSELNLTSSPVRRGSTTPAIRHSQASSAHQESR